MSSPPDSAAAHAHRVASLVTMAILASTVPAQGQIFELMRIIGEGGSWLGLPVTAGRASLQGPAVPVAGLSLDGCLQVWDGHSGEWTIRAEDRLGESRLDVTALPGQPVRFEFRGGVRAQLEVAVEWSEERDTTLHVWVGVAAPSVQGGDRDICQPPPGQVWSRAGIEVRDGAANAALFHPRANPKWRD